jgi:ankyrin
MSLMIATLVSVGAARDTRLVDAARDQNREAVRALLEQHVDVNAPQSDGATALHWAAYRDDVDMTSLLIRAGANVNAANDLGITALHLACANGSAAVVAGLLQAGADPNAVSSAGVAPVLVAARTGSVSAVEALLAHGANVNATEPVRGQTALMWAVAQGHPGVVRTLIQHGADITARTRVSRLVVNRGGPNGTSADTPYVGEVEKGGSTALLFAARQGNLESARLLLAAGADVNDESPDGYSVTLLASHSGHGALASWLLEQGADPNANGAGFTPLHSAALAGDLDLVKALLSHGADPNAPIIRATPVRRLGEDLALPAPLVGATPFFLAAKFADVSMMRALAAAGANPLAPAADGTTPLMAAAGVGWSGTTNRRGIDVTANKAAAPEPHQAEADTLDAVKLALELGADVNVANRAGETALFGPVPKGFTSVVKLLVEHGARLDVKARRGQTLMSLTVPRGTTGTPAAMLQAMAALLRELGVRE